MKMKEINEAPSGFGIRHFQMLMMCLCATVIYIARSSMGAAILAMTDASQNSTDIEIYVWSEEVRGVVLSSFFWGYMLMQIPAGILCKRFGAKPLLLVALSVNGCFALATPVLVKVGGWMAVCAVRMCMGLTQACFMPGSHTLIGQWAPPQERTRLSTLAYAGIQIGTIMTMPLCGLLASTSLGWKLIFYSMGSLALTTAILFWFFTASTPRQHRFIGEAEVDYIERSLNNTGKQEQIPIPWRKILTSVPVYAIFCTHVGFNWTFTIFLVQMPTYLKNAMGINLKDSASLSALPFAAQWITSVICSFVGDYLINKNVLTITTCRKLFNSIACIGAGLGLIAISFLNSEHKVWALVLLTFTGGMLGGVSAGYVLNPIDLAPRFGGVIFGMSNCVANLVGLLAPLTTGFVLGDDPTDISRWRIVFSIAATLIISLDVVYRTLGTCELQPWNSQSTDASYDMGSIKKVSLKNNELEIKEEKVYSFQNKQ